jgi:squalene-hopene/tetraprenyl-beta-curcumene cyclase
LRNAVRWLLDLQNRDGGWPTFCRGWGTLPFDRSAPDLTAHALRALLPRTDPEECRAIAEGCEMFITEDPVPDWPTWAEQVDGIQAGFRCLARSQRPDGCWLPLWFGNQHAEGDINPAYGTARVLAAYRDASWLDSEPAQRGLTWLLDNQNPDGGWGGVRGTPSSVEETALATEIVLSFDSEGDAARRGVAWLLDRVEDNSFREPCPIGFYFAKLWYFERLYPLIFTTAALRRAVRVYCEGPRSEDNAIRASRMEDRG